jgi:hypothetical protein
MCHVVLIFLNVVAVTNYTLRSSGGGVNWDGAWRGLVTIVELIDPRSYSFQSAVYGRLIYTVIYVGDRIVAQANPNPRLPPPPELRSRGWWWGEMQIKSLVWSPM